MIGHAVLFALAALGTIALAGAIIYAAASWGHRRPGSDAFDRWRS